MRFLYAQSRILPKHAGGFGGLVSRHRQSGTVAGAHAKMRDPHPAGPGCVA